MNDSQSTGTFDRSDFFQRQRWTASFAGLLRRTTPSTSRTTPSTSHSESFTVRLAFVWLQTAAPHPRRFDSHGHHHGRRRVAGELADDGERPYICRSRRAADLRLVGQQQRAVCINEHGPHRHPGRGNILRLGSGDKSGDRPVQAVRSNGHLYIRNAGTRQHCKWGNRR